MPNPTSKLNLVINGATTQLDIHDANAVDLSNNQTVGGIKTFSNAPVVSSINLDGKTIDTDANDNMTFNSHIVDTIEEQGDGYIRYSNGIQICWGSLSWQSACSSPWGILYDTSGISGSYAKSFAEIPSVNACGSIGNSVNAYASMLECNVASGSKTSTPKFNLCRPTSVEQVIYCVVRYMAIGKWK